MVLTKRLCQIYARLSDKSSCNFEKKRKFIILILILIIITSETGKTIYNYTSYRKIGKCEKVKKID